MNNAAEQIKEYILGTRNLRIECNDERVSYRLFREFNSLVAILDAYTENKGNNLIPFIRVIVIPRLFPVY